MAKPADFYVGVLDFFSILLPGAVVSWTVWVWLDGPTALANTAPANPALANLLPHGDAALWVGFGLAAFASGHIVFMLASWVDLSFDTFRKYVLRRTLGKHRQRMEHAALQAASALRLQSLHAEPIAERPVPRAETWAREILRRYNSESTISEPAISEPANTYQWSRAVLRLHAPAALSEVLRLEADSKFFRSLFVVFVFLSICGLVHIPGPEKLPVSTIILVLLAGLSYWRYAEQRQKGILEAYRSVIVLFSTRRVAAKSKQKFDEED